MESSGGGGNGGGRGQGKSLTMLNKFKYGTEHVILQFKTKKSVTTH
jgi:hypothetical protein